jgi:predicted transcriptional regulator
VPKNKLTVEFNDHTNEVLENLANDMGTTKVEVVRRALVAYDYLKKANRAGHKVAIADDNDKVLKELVNL